MRTEAELRQLAESALLPMLRSVGPYPERLEEAMAYSLQAGGKRLRPVMLLAACEMAGGDAEEALPWACAMEMIHTYSLIHDDLPAMDNDDLRRGKPTSHKVFGEALAILAGDGLLAAAMALMTREALKAGDLRGLRAAETIARYSGAAGMIAGQVCDVLGEGSRPTEELVRYIHTHKTADMFRAAVEAGLLLAGAPAEQVAAGSAYALHYGLAFQMMDDWLDCRGDTAALGKTAGKDAAEGKLTWVALKGPEATLTEAEAEAQAAVAALAPFGGRGALLRAIAEESVRRRS